MNMNPINEINKGPLTADEIMNLLFQNKILNKAIKL